MPHFHGIDEAPLTREKASRLGPSLISVDFEAAPWPALEPRVPAASGRVAAKTRVMSWIAKVGIAGLALVLLGATAGYLFEWRVVTRDAQRYPMPGRLVDVGGYRLHINCTGAGSPTVIFDSGFVGAHREWKDVQPWVEQRTLVCSYDRAGLGWSDPSPNPRTSKWMARELHTLLVNAEVPGPYVLVGHSNAAMNIRVFTAQYPSEVAGLVFVDGTNPNYLPENISLDVNREREIRFFEWTASFGIPRLFGHCPLGPTDCRQFLQTFARSRKGRAESAREARAAGSLGDLPLTVIARDPEFYLKNDNDADRRLLEEGWQDSEQELARLSTRSTFMIARNSGHSIPAMAPQFVVTAVDDMVTVLRADAAKAGTAPSREARRK
jgi:pimeloyl-ACP methyl ester carboxylesterase